MRGGKLRAKVSHIRPSLRAIATLWREEYSFRVQVASGIVVVFVGWMLGISRAEWIAVVLVSGAVFATEALNTALEELCDHVTPDQHPKIGKIKDLGSGASLLMGITAIIIGLIIFIPALARML